MNLKRVVVGVVYKKAAKELNALPNLVRELSGAGDQLPNTEFAGGIKIRAKGEPVILVVEPMRWVVGVESEVSCADFINRVEKVFQKIKDNLTFGDVAQVGVRTTWVEEADNFEEIVKQSKKVFFNDNALLQEAVDIGMPLTLKHEDADINYTFGPMEKAQFIQQFADIKDREDIPDIFYTVDVNYVVNPNKQLDFKGIKGLIEKGFECGKSKADLTSTLLNS